MRRCSGKNLWTEQAVVAKNVDFISATSHGIKKFSGRVIGIDPSLRGTGIAIIDVYKSMEAHLVFSKTIRMAPKYNQSECVLKIFDDIYLICCEYEPCVAAMEQTIYVQNFQTAQILGVARGAAMVSLAKKQVALHEYAPLRIKQAVVGFGRAKKGQVATMVRSILRLENELAFDEADACAVALCHAFTLKIS
ncbi:MAG: crossover junction endodeoxyribonuclease RuvC [Puniceicoccales bacterium]|jgi:crossover junction endodeoxyribonuclease RuvC|nr:crossover junction endodeoxyribonuclease RuvC [Puniceicoccales bacterium]